MKGVLRYQPGASVRGVASSLGVRPETLQYWIDHPPGEAQRVRIPLSRRERRTLRRPQRGHVYSAVRDAQGLTRAVTAPVRIVRR